MMQFAPREEFMAAFDHFDKHLQAAEAPWWDSANAQVFRHLVRGEIEPAKTIALNEQLSEDITKSLSHKYRFQSNLYRELAQQPEVAARLRDREMELAALRSEVETMLLEPEWNQ